MTFNATQETETALLGALLSDNSLVGEVEGIITQEDFFFERNKLIYGAILYKYACGEAADIITTSSYLRETGRLETVGGATYVSELVDAIPDVANASYYAEEIKKLALARSLSQLSSKIGLDLERMSPVDIIDDSMARLMALSESSTDSNQVTIGEMLNAEVDYLINLSGEGEKDDTVLTGYHKFDIMTGGLKPGEMHVIAARPSLGKTALATCIALNIAKSGRPVMLFSLEMGRRSILRRILAMESGIPYRSLEDGTFSEEQVERLRISRDKLRTVPLIIDDNSTPTLGSIRTKVRRQMARTGLGAFVFDYLQLACGDQEDRGEISMWSRGLRAIAKDIGVTFLPVAQLSRYVEHRDDPRPKLADLRGSGQIEQDADTVSFLFNKDQSNKLWTTWYLAKQRNGPCGDIELEFQNRTTLFKERNKDDAPF